MLTKNIESMLNDQIRKEFFSSYLYLSMSAYFSSITLNGYAHWYRVQAQEERDHAVILYDYIIKANGRVTLAAIEKPATEFDSVEDVLRRTIEHEASVTESIYNIVDNATRERDFKTVQILNWFVNEQVEEESNAADNLGKYKLMGTDGKGLYLLDQEMNARIYAPPAILAGAQQ